MHWHRAATLMALLTSVSSCNLYFSDLKIVNGTDSRVTGLTVSDYKKTWQLGDLDSGKSVVFSGHLSGEAGYASKIAWTWRGKRYSDQPCYYTEGMPARGTLTIVGDRLKVTRCD